MRRKNKQRVRVESYGELHHGEKSSDRRIKVRTVGMRQNPQNLNNHHNIHAVEWKVQWNVDPQKMDGHLHNRSLSNDN